jgi:hypothetical protein
MRVVRVRARGRDIFTTAEHPFFVVGQGWRPAKELRPGDLLSSHDGREIAVEEVGETGEEVPVYNVRVADYHTYFVGCDEWGFSVWAHNACIYRGLSPADWLTLSAGIGIVARNPGAANDIVSHVAGRQDSQWISATKSYMIARGGDPRQPFSQVYGVATIDTDNLIGPWYDISNGIPVYPITGQMAYAPMFTSWARNAQEVVIQAIVPMSAIVRVD